MKNFAIFMQNTVNEQNRHLLFNFVTTIKTV